MNWLNLGPKGRKKEVISSKCERSYGSGGTSMRRNCGQLRKIQADNLQENGGFPSIIIKKRSKAYQQLPDPERRLQKGIQLGQHLAISLDILVRESRSVMPGLLTYKKL